LPLVDEGVTKDARKLLFSLRTFTPSCAIVTIGLVRNQPPRTTLQEKATLQKNTARWKK
jgi:hypothetical protein